MATILVPSVMFVLGAIAGAIVATALIRLIQTIE